MTTWIIIIAITVFVAVFLLLREFFCWYFKINKTIELQKETNELLERIADQNTDPTKPKPTTYTKY